MAMPVIHECHSPSIKDKLKHSICCFRACNNHHEIFEPEDAGRKQQPQTPRSPYEWLKTTAQELEIRDRCWGLIGKRGKNRKRHNSTDFQYDPASYSLNFEDDTWREDELPLNSFTARLPATPERLPVESPPSMAVAVPRRELVGWS